MAPSNTPLQNRIISKNLGKTRGTSSKWQFSFLCVSNYAHPDMHEAIDNAVTAKKADALINMHWYATDYCWLMAKYTKLTVKGEAVKLGIPDAANATK